MNNSLPIIPGYTLVKDRTYPVENLVEVIQHRVTAGECANECNNSLKPCNAFTYRVDAASCTLYNAINGMISSVYLPNQNIYTKN